MLEKSCGWWLIWYFLFFCHGGAEATESRPYIDPDITQSSKVMSPQGQPLVINCGIDGFPKPLITWNKSLEVMALDNRVSILSNGSLHFMLLTTGDQGYYYCDGKNDLGQVKSVEIFVEVAYINPHFEQEPDSQYIRGKSRTLPCSPPASHPPANVTWCKDSQPMKYRAGEHAVYILDPAKSIWDLFFTDIQKQDEGIYFCIASNNFAVPMSRISKSADVQIEGQLQWVVKEKITDYGQDLTLFCPVENCCSNETQAGWFVAGKSKILDVQKFSNDPNSKYHGTYNTVGFGFVIRNLSEADLNVTYHCNYGFNESTPTILLHSDVFKENVPDKDKDEENNTVTENNTRTKVIIAIVGCIIGAVGLIIIGIIVYCVRRKKREEPPDPPPNPDEVPLMEDVAPGQPRNIKVNVLSPKRIEVSWLPPTDSANISYNIYFNDSSVMEHPDNNYILEGLIPDTVYHIQVSAITNGREGEKSPMIEVKTSPLGSPIVEVHQSSYSVTTGKKVTLVSTVSSSRRINDVYWQKNIDGSITFMNFDTITMKYSGSTTTTPSLTIFNASFSDAGTYTCWAINDVGRGRSTITTLSVTESPPTVEVQQSSYSVTTGKKVTLGCTVSSRLDINNVEWERNIGGSITFITSNTNIAKYNGSDTTTPSLTILNASPSDAGTYTCCASSNVGTGRSTTTTLSVTENPPTVKVQQSSYSVTTGKNVTLGCTVSSRLDIINVEWERNIGGSITLITSNTNIDKYNGSETTTPSLTILNASSSDAGIYTCFAKNRVGTGQSTTTTLKVTENSPTVKVHHPSHSVTTGDDVTLVCTVNSSLDVSCVEWQRNTGDSIKCITSDTNIEKYNGGNVNTPSLTILNASSSDAGTYTCYARSSAGKGHSTPTTLSVTEKDLHRAIVEKYRTKPKIPKDLLADKTFLSKLLEECGKNTEGLYTDSSGGIDVYFPATLLVVVMKYRPETKIVEEVVNDMLATLKSKSPSTAVIVYHRSVKTAMEKVCKEIDKEDCEKQIDKGGEKRIYKEDCEKLIKIFRKLIEKHKLYYSASSCIQQCIDKSRQ